jgi:hypothetical protein
MTATLTQNVNQEPVSAFKRPYRGTRRWQPYNTVD